MPGDFCCGTLASTPTRSIHLQRTFEHWFGSPATSGGPPCSSPIRAAAGRASTSSNRWRKSRRSSRAIPRSGCPTTCSCCRNTCARPRQGVVRLEFLGGELLYAMRVKDARPFNLCPRPSAIPTTVESACALPADPSGEAPPVEFALFRTFRPRRFAPRSHRRCGRD